MKTNMGFCIEIVSGRLTERRFIHSMNTAEMCRELAQKHGFNPEKAELAGILHDICKEEREEETKRLLSSEILSKPGRALEPLEKTEHKLWHAPAGAAYIYEVFGIDDDEMIDAIRFHTVGRPEMTKLDKILYLGDLVERGRIYPDVEKYREYALRDLNYGMYEALKWILATNSNENKTTAKYSFESYNYYLKKMERK